MTITKENFNAEVMASELPVLLDFWASWCGPCQMLAPVLEEIERDYAGTVKVGKVNVDEEPELTAQFGIESIPTVLLIKNGAITAKSVGYRPKADLLKLFAE